MSCYPEEGCTQIGWKVWYHDGQKETIYSSKEHVWEELPAEGVQFLRRYHKHPNGRIVPENINGDDLYLENRLHDKEVVNDNLIVKAGTHKTHAEIRDVLDYARDNTQLSGEINNSTELYVKEKNLIGWELIFDNGDIYKAHWELSPKSGVAILLRGMECEGQYWIEQVYNDDLYVLGAQEEVDLCANNKKVKRGLMVPFEVIDELTKRASVDREVFYG